jgi:UDP-glucose 4-epimerase
MILVTGGAGFIGSHVVDELVKLGKDVVVLDDLSGGFLDNINPKAHFVKGSICDQILVDNLFQQHAFAYVYHFAAYAAEGLSHFIKTFNYINNLLGSINLINASVKYGKTECFVFTSSIAVYGAIEPPMRETQIPHPEDPYGIAKYAVELDLKETKEMFGVDFIVFRPHNVYGERQNIGDRYRNVIGIHMNQLMKGEPVTVFGDGCQKRAFSYICDIAPIIARAPEVPDARNRTFNIGADTPFTINQLVDIIMDKMGIKGKVNYLPARKEVLHAYADHSLLRTIFGNFKATALDEGIGRMAAWAKMAGSRESSIFANVEVVKNMPATWRSIVESKDIV